MPWADKDKCRAAVRDWMRRNRDKVIAAKRRWRAKQTALRLLATVTHKAPRPAKIPGDRPAILPQVAP